MNADILMKIRKLTCRFVFWSHTLRVSHGRLCEQQIASSWSSTLKGYFCHRVPASAAGISRNIHMDVFNLLAVTQNTDNDSGRNSYNPSLLCKGAVAPSCSLAPCHPPHTSPPDGRRLHKKMNSSAHYKYDEIVVFLIERVPLPWTRTQIAKTPFYRASDSLWMQIY